MGRHFNSHIPLIGAVVAITLTGCMVGPNFKKPDAPIAQHWIEAPTTQISTDTSVQANWWKAFNDPVLDKLVEMA
jgi:outer membrane protein TolC